MSSGSELQTGLTFNISTCWISSVARLSLWLGTELVRFIFQTPVVHIDVLLGCHWDCLNPGLHWGIIHCEYYLEVVDVLPRDGHGFLVDRAEIEVPIVVDADRLVQLAVCWGPPEALGVARFQTVAIVVIDAMEDVVTNRFNAFL